MSDPNDVTLTEILANPKSDAFAEALDLAGLGGDYLAAASVANAAELARATRDLAANLRGITGRPGDPGPEGRPGKDGESIAVFRSGYDELEDRSDPSAVVVAHAIHGTPQDAPGWWIERWPTSAPVVVELAEGVQGGQLTWAERGTYTYRRSEAATTARRSMLKKFIRREPEMWVAQMLDYLGTLGIAPSDTARSALALLCTRPELYDAMVDYGSVLVTSALAAALGFVAQVTP